MIKNYFKIAWRDLFKDSISSLINIGGLTGGLTAGLALAILIALWTDLFLYFEI